MDNNTKEMIRKTVQHAIDMGLEVTSDGQGSYLIRHPLGPHARVYGRVSLQEFLRGYEFNEDVNGYIIGGAGKWMDPTNE